MQKQFSRRLVQYELRNIAGNPFVILFGVVFPILMCALFSVMMKRQVPKETYPEVITSIFITMSMIIPMAILLIGYAANYSQELEKEIPLRMNLFGFRERTVLAARMIAYFIFLTVALLIYLVSAMMIIDIQVPAPSSVVILVAALYLLSVILFVLAHGISNIFCKFGPTYAVSMFLYFGFMILSGMMGITVDHLPKGMKAVARVFPMSYISSDFVGFWQGGSYNFAPIVQSYLFFGALSLIILILSTRRRQRIVK
ncbi:ABC-2 type transport system permease protein [Anaerotaenia torta]|uniref:ABC transporter permease n=1 Tax=Anaerotaenia torta TaxID=433293 RepID=UPI003D1BA1D3